MIKTIFLKIIRVYQIFFSPGMGQNCRFWPSCSEYCSLALQKHGLLKGVWMGIKRVLRCYPWSAGGVDLP